MQRGHDSWTTSTTTPTFLRWSESEATWFQNVRSDDENHCTEAWITNPTFEIIACTCQLDTTTCVVAVGPATYVNHSTDPTALHFLLVEYESFSQPFVLLYCIHRHWQDIIRWSITAFLPGPWAVQVERHMNSINCGKLELIRKVGQVRPAFCVF